MYQKTSSRSPTSSKGNWKGGGKTRQTGRKQETENFTNELNTAGQNTQRQ